MELYYMLLGLVISLEGAAIMFYSYRTLENILKNPKYSLRMFALRDEAVSSFRILGISLILYGIFGTFVGVIDLAFPSLVSPQVADKGPIAVTAISSIGVIYFLRTISIITEKD